jgi:cytochrome oxidase Cu insertion factor (SCO1/SenC/PrrC family)
MSEMIDMIKGSVGDVLLPIMISCDPLRDPPETVKKYLEDFHPDIVGLTGTHEEIKQTCKEYRVYFSTPPKVTPGEDYLVDHSIYFFLMGRAAISPKITARRKLTYLQILRVTSWKFLGGILRQRKLLKW